MLRWRVPSKSRDQDSAAPFFFVHNLIDVEEAGVESGFGVVGRRLFWPRVSTAAVISRIDISPFDIGFALPLILEKKPVCVVWQMLPVHGQVRNVCFVFLLGLCFSKPRHSQKICQILECFAESS